MEEIVTYFLVACFGAVLGVFTAALLVASRGTPEELINRCKALEDYNERLRNELEEAEKKANKYFILTHETKNKLASARGKEAM